MLDRDPNADQPPDPSLLRVRSRSHKPKNAPKKQPQRGLGVAQLEKLRLEEQSKQQEAVCLASLQHQNLHHHGHLHQQEQYSPHFLHQHHPFQQQHLNQSSSLCISPQIKLIEPPLDNSRFPLPFGKLNVAQNSFLPLTVMASRRQTPSLPLLIPQQQLGNEDETSLSPLSHVQDLCSPGHLRPSSAESNLWPLPMHTSPASQGENPWLSHLYDRDSNKEKDSTITFLSSASCSDSDTKMQSLDHGTTESTNAAISTFHGGNGNLHISMGKLYMQSEGTPAPFTELCLSGRPLDWHIPSRTRLEPPPASIASGGVQMRELSSFQTISLCPTWSPADKVFNRKRSWACTQELARQAEAFKGVDLNISVDEMESEVTERDPKISLAFTIRDGFNLSPGLSPKKLSSENDLKKVLLAEKTCGECGAMKVDKAFPDKCVNGAAAFLSLRKRSLDHEKWEVETSGEFLTLGPSCSSIQMMRSAHGGTGNCSTCPVLREPGENASSWPSQQVPFEQAKGAHFSALSRAASNDDMLRLMECKPNYLHSSFQRKTELSDFFVWSKMEGCSSCLQECSSTDESLDLELRLSI